MRNIVLLSGGLDSATLLYTLYNKAPLDQTIAVFFNYGQKAAEKERAAAKAVTESVKAQFIERNAEDLFAGSRSSLLDRTKSVCKDTEVEFRNGTLIAAAITLARIVFGNEECCLYYGAAMMREPFPDCTEEFVKAYNQMAQIATGGKVHIKAPLIRKGKDEIMKDAKELGVPIDKTWSCYEGRETPCGICPACIDRTIIGGQNVNNPGTL